MVLDQWVAVDVVHHQPQHAEEVADLHHHPHVEADAVAVAEVAAEVAEAVFHHHHPHAEADAVAVHLLEAAVAELQLEADAEVAEDSVAEHQSVADMLQLHNSEVVHQLEAAVADTLKPHNNLLLNQPLNNLHLLLKAAVDTNKDQLVVVLHQVVDTLLVKYQSINLFNNFIYFLFITLFLYIT